MNRRNFFKNTALGLLGFLLLPKALVSSNNEVKKPTDLTKDDAEIPNDLIKFAKSFSEKYKKLSCGTYTSDCGKYRIDYLHRRRTENKSPYGVDRRTGIMEFSKSKLVNMPPSYVFSGIIWCSLMKDPPHDYVVADIKSIECSLKNGFSKKELFKQHCKILANSPSELNRQRITSLLKKK